MRLDIYSRIIENITDATTEQLLTLKPLLKMNNEIIKTYNIIGGMDRNLTLSTGEDKIKVRLNTSIKYDSIQNCYKLNIIYNITDKDGNTLETEEPLSFKESYAICDGYEYFLHIPIESINKSILLLYKAVD